MEDAKTEAMLRFAFEHPLEDRLILKNSWNASPARHMESLLSTFNGWQPCPRGTCDQITFLCAKDEISDECLPDQTAHGEREFQCFLLLGTLHYMAISAMGMATRGNQHSGLAPVYNISASTRYSQMFLIETKILCTRHRKPKSRLD